MAHTIDAKPGDLIEIFRGHYEHWALYIGEYEVVHLSRIRENLDGSSSPSYTLSEVLDGSLGMVRREKLCEVLYDNDFQINNILDDKYEVRDRHVIVREACRKVGWVMPYSLSNYNCEHFATEQRYGKPESRQVKKARVILGVATAGVAVAVALGGFLFSSLSSKGKDTRREYD